MQILDTDKSGFIEIDDVKAKYDTSKHPDVISGKRTSEEVLRCVRSPCRGGKEGGGEMCMRLMGPLMGMCVLSQGVLGDLRGH